MTEEKISKNGKIIKTITRLINKPDAKIGDVIKLDSPINLEFEVKGCNMSKTLVSEGIVVKEISKTLLDKMHLLPPEKRKTHVVEFSAEVPTAYAVKAFHGYIGNCEYRFMYYKIIITEKNTVCDSSAGLIKSNTLAVFDDLVSAEKKLKELEDIRNAAIAAGR